MTGMAYRKLSDMFGLGHQAAWQSWTHALDLRILKNRLGKKPLLHHCIKLLEGSLLLTRYKDVKSPDGEIVGQRGSTSQQRQRQEKAGGISFKKSTVSVASQTSRKRTGSVSRKRTGSFCFEPPWAISQDTV